MVSFRDYIQMNESIDIAVIKDIIESSGTVKIKNLKISKDVLFIDAVSQKETEIRRTVKSREDFYQEKDDAIKAMAEEFLRQSSLHVSADKCSYKINQKDSKLAQETGSYNAKIGYNWASVSIVIKIKIDDIKDLSKSLEISGSKKIFKEKLEQLSKKDNFDLFINYLDYFEFKYKKVDNAIVFNKCTDSKNALKLAYLEAFKQAFLLKGIMTYDLRDTEGTEYGSFDYIAYLNYKVSKGGNKVHINDILILK